MSNNQPSSEGLKTKNMDIKKIISEYSNASEKEKKEIEKRISIEFSALSDEEKKEVQNVFLRSLDNKIDEAKKLIEEIDLKLELERVSKYVSMAYIAENFFGKSRQWLNNRIKGNLVNGRPAKFTSDEINKFSSALIQISGEIKDTALHITC
jgi:hypothetical protein